MGRAKGIIVAFVALGKARQPPRLAQGADAGAPSGQDLVRIGLMPHIPDQPVARRVKNVMQGHRQLNHPKASPKMATGDRDGTDGFLPQLVGKGWQAIFGNPAQICREQDGIEKRRGRHHVRRSDL